MSPMPLPERPTAAPGTVVLVGAGPGDPDLLTVGGLRELRAADVVIHDRLIPHACLAECRHDAELIDVGKIPRGCQTSQERINELLVEHAQAGRRVVRFKGGDVFVFGRGGEEAIACAEAGVPVRVIPGVTSAVSVPGLAGIPVTHRTLVQGFTVVSGHVAPGDARSRVPWAELARSGMTLVLLMGVHHLPEIAATLIDAGLPADTPAAVLCDGATDKARTHRTRLDGLAELAPTLEPPAITVIGDVAALDLLGG